MVWSGVCSTLARLAVASKCFKCLLNTPSSFSSPFARSWGWRTQQNLLCKMASAQHMLIQPHSKHYTQVRDSAEDKYGLTSRSFGSSLLWSSVQDDLGMESEIVLLAGEFTDRFLLRPSSSSCKMIEFPREHWFHYGGRSIESLLGACSEATYINIVREFAEF